MGSSHCLKKNVVLDWRLILQTTSHLQRRLRAIAVSAGELRHPGDDAAQRGSRRVAHPRREPVKFPFARVRDRV